MVPYVFGYDLMKSAYEDNTEVSSLSEFAPKDKDRALLLGALLGGSGGASLGVLKAMKESDEITSAAVERGLKNLNLSKSVIGDLLGVGEKDNTASYINDYIEDWKNPARSEYERVTRLQDRFKYRTPDVKLSDLEIDDLIMGGAPANQGDLNIPGINKQKAMQNIIDRAKKSGPSLSVYGGVGGILGSALGAAILSGLSGSK